MSPGDSDEWDPNKYEFDPRPSDDVRWFSVEETPKEKIAVIRTSDRITFRRCRRKWAWSSHLRGNLGNKEGQSPLWMGSGFHFALEDFHGLNQFGSASDAFRAYVQATRRNAKHARALPATWMEDSELACGMLDYYSQHWLRNRDPLKTFVWNGIPQTEVNFRVDIPFNAKKWGYDRVVYSGTIDRVIIDENGQLWIVEYKTAKAIQTLHLANDSQVSSYCWAGNLLYGQPITGVIYQQHRKDIPHEPKILATGRLSTDKRQLITHAAFRNQIVNIYGAVAVAPKDYVDLLNYLAEQETPRKDKFVQRDYIQRNVQQAEAEGVKIMMEIEEMLNPDLPLYPNPDRTCQFMCSFNGPCVSMDDGSDYAYELEIMMQAREAVYDTWRDKLTYPPTVMTTTTEGIDNNG